MADWSTIASLATAGGTLVLAIATFSSVRSANRSARASELALLAGIRPLLLTARPEDPPEKIMWQDEHFARAVGGRGVFERSDEAIYLGAALRNVGTGLAVLHGWYVWDEYVTTDDPRAPDAFRRLTRDLYIAPGDNGFWQGAIRQREDPDCARIGEVLARRVRFSVDLLYGDQEGGQHTVTRYGFVPYDDFWLCSTARHFFLDHAAPR